MRKLVLFLTLFAQIAFAQIEGQILDASTQKPLPGANVYLKTDGHGAVSDAGGNFYIRASLNQVNSDTLIISYLGYEEYKQPISSSKKVYIILMEPSELSLGQSILVTGERENLAKQEMPHLREAISVDELQRYGSSELGDIVKKMPSIRLEGNDLDGRHVQIRGSNASEVNVYLDGILINSISTDNSADLSIVPAEQIGHLEILKGGNLPLLGQGAFGGVMNIFTRKTMEPEVRIKAKVGNFDTRQMQGSVQLPVFKNFYIGYFGQYHNMKPDIEYFPGERFSSKTKNDKIDTKRINHSVNLDYYHPIGELRAKYFNYNLDYEKPGWSDQKQTHLYAISFQGANEFNITMNQIDSKDLVERYIVESTRYLSDYETKRVNLRISKNFKFNISNFQFLTEYYHDELETLSKLKNDDSETTYYTSSLYDNRAGVAGVYSFEDAYDSLANLTWRVFFGARGDFTASGNQDFSNSWGAQLKYKKNNWEINPYLSYGKNVKYPSLLQSAYVRDLVQFSNSSPKLTLLKPEYNNSYEVGSRYSMYFANNLVEQIDMAAAYFVNITYNKILKRPFGEEIVQTQTGRNTTKGYEASVKFFQLNKDLTMTVAYTNLNIDNPLLYEYKPEDNLNLQLEYVSPFGFHINSIFFYEGKSYAWYLDAENELITHRIKGSYDLDLSVGYRLNFLGLGYEFHLAGYNILDNSGYDYYYLKKRYLQASFAIKY